MDRMKGMNDKADPIDTAAEEKAYEAYLDEQDAKADEANQASACGHGIFHPAGEGDGAWEFTPGFFDN
jgi:hypothetical protein